MRISRHAPQCINLRGHKAGSPGLSFPAGNFRAANLAYTCWCVPELSPSLVRILPSAAVQLRAPIDWNVSNYEYYHVLRSEEHTSELQSRLHLVCRLLLEKKKD